MTRSLPPASGKQRRRSPAQSGRGRFDLRRVLGTSGRPPSTRRKLRQPSAQGLPPLLPETTRWRLSATSASLRSHSKASSRTRRRPNGPTLRPKPPATEQTWFRLLLVWLVLVAGAVLLILNLFRIQVLQGTELKERAQAQQIVPIRPFAPRRPIVDAQGNVLAIDKPVYDLYAHPKLFKQPSQEIADALAPLISMPAAQILQKFSEGESGLKITTNLPEDLSRRITFLQMDGLELIQHPQRLYPQQELFAEVVGYVNDALQGQSGVEYSQQTILQTSTPEVDMMRAGDGSVLPSNLPEELLRQDGLRLQLTVDSRLQRIARAALRDQMKKYHAKRGTVIVMDVQDGALKALASEPTYDPNLYYQATPESMRNWALTDLYEPGSTFKPINVAIALEEGTVKATDVFQDEGQIFVSGWPIQNFDYDQAGPRGAQTVSEIVQYSSNVGMVHIVRTMKSSVYYSWLEKLGLGKPTGIDLPFEGVGQIKTREQFEADPIEATTAAFGQGFSLTPIQLTQLHSAIANGGRLVTPHVVEGLYDSNGELRWQSKLPTAKRLFSPKNTQDVLAMMEKVVAEGTGKPAQIPGYRVAGKTGTAQKASPNGGYIPGARITSFVSIFPEDKPRYTVLVVFDEPQGADAFGSTVAAPVAKTVMEALISIGQIPPSQPIESSSETQTEP
ncbi:MAG TPA: penicillin-binding protein 2 [Synechococcales cyanobacterium M55_K2018_004]|nr:penicillin-binding protein 2 [Synechococcales cyanobacterium M55_K2018_004]